MNLRTTAKTLLVSALLLTGFGAEAYRHCVENWFCISKDNDKNSIRLNNLTDFPVVVTIEGNWRIGKGEFQAFVVSRQLLNKDSTEHHVFNLPLADVWPSLEYSVSWAGGVLLAEHDNTATYRLPFAPNSDFRMVQGFGGGYSHYGSSKYAVDFAMPIGTPVHAAREGVVIDVEQRHNRGGASRRYSKYANYIVLLHPDGTTGEYYHLQHNGVRVKLGDPVQQGQLIGLSGNTGFSSLPHLHFAVYQAKPFGEYQSLPFEFN